MHLQKVNGYFVKSKGFWIRDGKRVQKRWTLGKDESRAIILAAKITQLWKERIETNKGNTAQIDAAGIEYQPSEVLPVWRDTEIINIDNMIHDRKLPLVEPNLTVLVGPDTEEDRPSPAYPLRKAVDDYVNEKKGRLGLRNMAAIDSRTVSVAKGNLTVCLQPFPGVVLIQQLDKAMLRKIRDYWLGTNHMGRPHTSKETVSERTAINYLRELRSFVRFCHNQEHFDYMEPKGIDELYHFKIHRKPVVLPTYDELATMYEGADDRMKCFMLLALNCGFRNKEILNLDQATLTNQFGVGIFKARDKTKKLTDQRHYWELWPETLKAIEENTLPDTQRLFVADVRQTSSDLIGKAFRKLRIKLVKSGKNIRNVMTFGSLRDYGASWIANEAQNEMMAKMYLAHSIASGATRFYVKADVTKLTPFLAKYREHLAFLGSRQIGEQSKLSNL